MRLRLAQAAAAVALVAASAAHAQADRSVLPIPAPAFDGQIAENVLDAKPGSVRPVRAPEGAPNVLMFMSDDVGFAMSSAFGGPVPTPNFERLAAQGQRYNRFHTTGICSPSRAALLTGRNHHNAGVGFLSDQPMAYPGYGGTILRETATIAQVLRLNGYTTAMFGKHHNNQGSDRSAAGPFDSWPTGLGFEYYFGFLNGDTDQFAPILYRGTTMVDPGEGKGRMVDKRLADDIIGWVHNQKAAAPDKPFLVYSRRDRPTRRIRCRPRSSPGSRASSTWAGTRMREESHRRQLAMGIIPKGTKLSPRSPQIPAWATLSAGQKAFAVRSMEVAAAQLAYQDEQVGRVLDELRRMGEYDNTLIVDGPRRQRRQRRDRTIAARSTSCARWACMTSATPGCWPIRIHLGGRKSYGNYAIGWAWAMNTPFPMAQAICLDAGRHSQRHDPFMGQHVVKPGGVCAQFGHLIDIAPTVLEAAKLPVPGMVLGARQKPMDGQSLLPSLSSCDAAKPRTQYFEIAGKIGLYHNGWLLSGENGRDSWHNEAEGGARPR